MSYAFAAIGIRRQAFSWPVGKPTERQRRVCGRAWERATRTISTRI